MQFTMIASVLALVCVSAGVVCANDDPVKDRKEIRKMAADTLKDLYKLQPSAQAAVQKSAGYAVFDNMGTNLLVVSTAAWFGNRRQFAEQAGYVHEDGVGWRRPRDGREGLSRDLRVPERQGAREFHQLRLVGFSANRRRRQGR